MSDERIYNSVTELVGNTPLVRLCRFEQEEKLTARLLIKLEGRNPAGSIKDRVALRMIRDAERDGKIRPGGVLIEPTSGNTGIGAASMGAALGYRVIIVMPDSMSKERQMLVRSYGAQLVLTPGALGMKGAIARAEELAASMPGAMILGQFDNPSNPAAHRDTTGPEIERDCAGHIDAFVAGVGTGGTFTGCASYLKSIHPSLLAVAVEPLSSAVLSGQPAGAHGLQGIGAGFVPQNCDRALIDEIICVKEEQAYRAARLLARCEGILCGISGGAALHAASELCRRPAFAGKTVVTVLPDGGERYLSTALFQSESYKEEHI